jgi:putative endonuclease
MAGFTYIVASARNGTIYTGVTSDLVKRAYQHRHGLIDGFSSKYGCKMLVWYEQHDMIEAAIVREKRIKEWQRKWKLELIEQSNSGWRDLSIDLLGPPDWVPACAGMTNEDKI